MIAVKPKQFGLCVGIAGQEFESCRPEQSGKVDFRALGQQGFAVMVRKIQENRLPEERKLHTFACELSKPAFLCTEKPLHQSFLFGLRPASI